VRIIFGLGNPGRKYRDTRHNIGYRVIEKLASERGAVFKRSYKLGASLAKLRIKAEDVVLVKPYTFMNRSGVCVKKTLDFYKLSPDYCLVIYDDIDLALGVLRFRKQGSAGTHKGMASVVACLGTTQINRLRLGIDGIYRVEDLAEYVLSDFQKEEEKVLNKVLSQAVSACIDWINFGGDYVMKNYN
jgi:PTH1 family peptidyl-tRNA hydrolase